MKRTLFEEIRYNKLRSFFLIIIFMILVAAVGAVIGFVWAGSFLFGLILSLIVGLVYTAIAYFEGKHMVLRLANAKPVTKKEYPFLYNTVEGLTIASGLKKMPEIYVIPEKAMNAFATGISPENSAIAVTQGLLDGMNREELEGVISHEMAHIKNFDIRVMMLAAVLVGVVGMLSHMFLRSLWFGSGRRDNEKGNAGAILMIIGIVLAILAPIIAQLVKLAVSRRREYLADASGASFTHYPVGLANALEKIKNDPAVLKSASSATASLYISNPLKGTGIFFANLFSTHPPIEDRIKKLKTM